MPNPTPFHRYRNAEISLLHYFGPELPDPVVARLTEIPPHVLKFDLELLMKNIRHHWGKPEDQTLLPMNDFLPAHVALLMSRIPVEEGWSPVRNMLRMISGRHTPEVQAILEEHLWEYFMQVPAKRLSSMREELQHPLTGEIMRKSLFKGIWGYYHYHRKKPLLATGFMHEYLHHVLFNFPRNEATASYALFLAKHVVNANARELLPLLDKMEEEGLFLSATSEPGWSLMRAQWNECREQGVLVKPGPLPEKYRMLRNALQLAVA